MSSDMSMFPGTRHLNAPEYRFVVEDLRTHKIVAEYPFKNVKYSNGIKEVGKMSGKVALTPEIMKQNPRKTLETGSNGCYILRNNDPVWAGIFFVNKYNENANTADVTANTYEHWFNKRIQVEDINVTNMDQLDIARLYVNSGNAAQIMDIEVDDRLSGVKRERNAYAYELNTIGDELSRLSNLENGFDYRIVPYREPDTGELKKKLMFGYPELSNNDENSPAYLFESNRNIIDSSVTFSSDDAAMRVYVIGEGEGESQKVAIADDIEAIAAGYPRYEIAQSYKSVKNQETLVSHAHRILEEARNPIAELDITVRGNDDPYVGSYSPGDWVRVKLDNLWFPDGYDNNFRVTGIDINLDDRGSETVDMKFTGPFIREKMIIRDSSIDVYVPPQETDQAEEE